MEPGDTCCAAPAGRSLAACRVRTSPVQDRYAGDVGDFGKLALLRALAPGRRLGVCWYRTDGAGETNNDGRHLGYLERPARFRHLDPSAFDALQAFLVAVHAEELPRAVASLESLGLLPDGSLFHGTLCPRPWAARQRWAAEMIAAVDSADLVFLDPDNGLETGSLSPKSAALAELAALRRPGRALLLYHHQTRFKGGAGAEVRHLADRLVTAGFQAIDAIRFRPYSSRFYFLLDADAELRERLARFAERWGREAELHAALA
jgi:hypothetical protein